MFIAVSVGCVLRAHLPLVPGRGAGSNVKFDSKCIKSEVSRLSHVLSDFENTKDALSKFCDASHREAAMKAIQAASNQILSSDILGDVVEVWNERQKFEQQQKKVEIERGRKEAAVRLKEAEKSFLGVMQKEAKQDQGAKTDSSNQLGFLVLRTSDCTSFGSRRSCRYRTSWSARTRIWRSCKGRLLRNKSFLLSSVIRRNKLRSNSENYLRSRPGIKHKPEGRWMLAKSSSQSFRQICQTPTLSTSTTSSLRWTTA